MKLPQVVQDAVERADANRKVVPVNTFGQGLIVFRADDYDTIRAELHRLTEIAEGVEPLVIRLGEVTEAFQRSDEQAERLGNRLAAANALLLDVSRYLDPRHYAEAIKRIQSHLQGAGDEA